MLGLFDYLMWLVGFLLAFYVVVYALAKNHFLTYFFLNIYLIATALSSAGEFFILRAFGFSSLEYRYFYYYTQTLLIVLLYFTIMQFYEQVFRDTQASRHVRATALLLLLATALFSYLVGHQRSGLNSRFVVELSQNLYFVGVVLTYLLWGAILKLRETRSRLIQLILALGIFFSLDAAGYALRNLFPGLEPSVLKWIPPVAGVWLPLAWAYALTRVSEDARLMPERLLARAR